MAIVRGGLVTKYEKAVGVVDGVNTTFTTTRPYVSGTLIVFYNGVALAPGASEDFIEVNSTTFQLNFAPITEGSYTDKVTVQYQLA